ncbi:hypothetical protein BD289DRAFT_439848 [Coniella lustricola]|uniref:Ubiquitin-like protease family profile domain-containing protein n=1 Tax=Coniella lustricola TaxID=2025994 RepID=A0A2T3A168_9PEZI|nr:hypothetical protein BD289DRAFT_439848 [Coniella lustricola]
MQGPMSHMSTRSACPLGGNVNVKRSGRKVKRVCTKVGTQQQLDNCDAEPMTLTDEGHQVASADIPANQSSVKEFQSFELSKDPWAGFISADDIGILIDPCGWLTSNIVDCLGQILVSQNEKLWYVSSQTYTLYIDDKPSTGANLVVSLHLGGNHWALGFTNTSACKFSIYDSMETKSHYREAEQILQQIVSRLDARLSVEDRALPWMGHQVGAEQQTEGDSCGVRVLVALLYNVAGEDTPPHIDLKFWRHFFLTLLIVNTPQLASTVSALPGRLYDLLSSRLTENSTSIPSDDAANHSDAFPLCFILLNWTKKRSKPDLGTWHLSANSS